MAAPTDPWPKAVPTGEQYTPGEVQALLHHWQGPFKFNDSKHKEIWRALSSQIMMAEGYKQLTDLDMLVPNPAC